MEKTIYEKVVSIEGEDERTRAKIMIALRQKKWGVELSISGSYSAEFGSGWGQCVDKIAQLFPNNSKIKRIQKVWRRWHLNGMHAGCIHQRHFEKEPYEKHRGAHCDICGYTYGTSWIPEPLPDEVIEEVKEW